MKFSFQAQDLKVTLSTVGFEGRLVLAFKRGNDRRETEPMQLTEEVHYCVDSAWTLCDPNHALLRGQCMLHTAWTLCMTLTLTLIQTLTLTLTLILINTNPNPNPNHARCCRTAASCARRRRRRTSPSS